MSAVTAGTIAATAATERWVTAWAGLDASSAIAQRGTSARATYTGHVRPEIAQTPSQVAIVAAPSTPEPMAIGHQLPIRTPCTTNAAAGRLASAVRPTDHSRTESPGRPNPLDRRAVRRSALLLARRSAPL